MSTVAFLGLGAMGTRMAGRLLDHGHDLVVWNRSPDKRRGLVERGARPASSPAEASADAEAVLTMLADPEALRAVTEGPSGVTATISPGAAMIEMSTVGPAAIERLARVLPTGVDLIDAPVLGSLEQAESGNLTIFMGGGQEEVRRWSPLLTVLGELSHVGPPGTGAGAKLVANGVLFGVLGVLGEALALGRALGLSEESAHAVLGHTPLAEQAQRRRATIESGRYPPRFALSLARKDADLVVAAASAAGVDARLGRGAASWLEDADEAGRGSLDYTAMLGCILAASGSDSNPGPGRHVGEHSDGTALQVGRRL